MRTYAIFSYSNLDGTFTEGCGDRSVILLDGRLSRENQKHIAAVECGRRGFDGYQIFRGRSLLDIQPVTDVIRPC